MLMSESLKDLRERFQRWRRALEGKGLKVNVGKTKMMVSGTEGEITSSKIDPCGECGKRVGSNRTEEPVDVLCDEVETVKGFCYFRECGELLRGRRFSLRMKGMVYQSCVRSAMLYESETWCLRESEMAILRRTERAMVRSMCGLKLVDRKNTQELMEMLGLKKTLDGMAKANGVRWYGHVIRREDDNILKKAMMMKVNGQRKRGRPKMTWKRQVEESVKKVRLKIKEAAGQTRWRKGVQRG